MVKEEMPIFTRTFDLLTWDLLPMTNHFPRVSDIRSPSACWTRPSTCAMHLSWQICGEARHGRCNWHRPMRLWPACAPICDQFVKRRLGCPAYVRYVDDGFVFADDKATL